jgi:hypothetical protein
MKKKSRDRRIAIRRNKTAIMPWIKESLKNIGQFLDDKILSDLQEKFSDINADEAISRYRKNT